MSELYDPSIAILSLAILLLIFGAIYGSYCAKVTYRLSGHRKRGSTIFSSSVCPACGKKIAIKDKVPIISYINLKGKCRKCGASLSKVDLIIEAAGVFLPFFFLWYDNLSLVSILDYLIAMTLISDFFIYQEIRQFPLTLSLYLFVLGISLIFLDGQLYSAFLGVGLAIFVTLLFSVLKRNKNFLENAFLFCALGLIFDWVGLVILLIIFIGLYLVYRIVDYFYLVDLRGGSILMIASLINLLFINEFQVIFQNIITFLTN